MLVHGRRHGEHLPASPRVHRMSASRCARPDMVDTRRARSWPRPPKTGCLRSCCRIDGRGGEGVQADGADSETWSGIDAVADDDMILDIGPASSAAAIEASASPTASAAVWNGPLRRVRDQRRSTCRHQRGGAQYVAKRTGEGAILSVAGGGDTLSRPYAKAGVLDAPVVRLDRRRCLPGMAGRPDAPGRRGTAGRRIGP